MELNIGAKQIDDRWTDRKINEHHQIRRQSCLAKWSKKYQYEKVITKQMTS